MGNQLVLRIDPELKEKARRIARSEGKTLSNVVRELLVEYVTTRNPENYIKELWDRIGFKLKSKGYKPTDVEKIFSEIRNKQISN